jgi:hypothetical protein
MEKGELHWDTLAKLIIMVLILIVLVYLIIIFKDRIYEIFNVLSDNF